MLIRKSEDFYRIKEEILSVGVASLDVEATSVEIEEADLIGFSLAYMKTDTQLVSIYVPYNHRVGENVDHPSFVLEHLRGLMRNEDMKLVFHNAKYDTNVLKKYDAVCKAKLYDTMIMAYLLNENRKAFKLKVLSNEEFGVDQKTFEDMLDGETIIDKTPEDIDEYGSDDAKYTLMLFNKYLPQIVEQGLVNVLEKIEMPLTRLIADMEVRGIRINVELLETIRGECRLLIEEYKRKTYDDLGGELNLNSPKQLREVIYTDLGLPIVKKTPKGAPSTDMEAIETLLARGHAEVSSLRKYRWYNKMLGTYVKGFTPKEGRTLVFPSCMQMTVVSGRLSYRGPNMQNVPVETDVGIRGVVIPYDEDECLVVADYNQIELVLAAHFSKDKTMMSIYEHNGDIHQRTADALGITRDHAKTINFGILYGLAPAHLSKELGVSFREARNYITEWFNTYKGVYNFKLSVEEFVRKNGYVLTLAGRRRRLPEIYSPDFKKQARALRQAVNSVIQGSGGDLVKFAMVKIAEKFKQEPPCRILFSVHDEIVASVPKDQAIEVCQEMQDIMENCIPLSVSIRASIGIVENWWVGKFYDKLDSIEIPQLLRGNVVHDPYIDNIEI